MEDRSTPTVPLVDLRTRAEQIFKPGDARYLRGVVRNAKEPSAAVSVTVLRRVNDLVVLMHDLLKALRDQTQEKATDFAWPQDVDGLLAMAAEWGTQKPGDMDASDVLIAKLAATLLLARQERDEYLALNRELVKRALPVETLDRERQITHLTNELSTAQATLTRLQSGLQQIEQDMRVYEVSGCYGTDVKQWADRLAVLTQ